MTFKTDSGGQAFRVSEWKLSMGTSTWGMKLSQLHRQSGRVRLMTYSLPSIEYVAVQLGRRPRNIWLICHSKFERRAHDLKTRYPEMQIAVHDELHAKILLIEPATLWLGSANFGDSGWLEITAGIRSRDAHDYAALAFDREWLGAREICA